MTDATSQAGDLPERPDPPKQPGAAPIDADHYSYRVYADPAMAERFDQMRFGGPIGALLAETQERLLEEYLGPVLGGHILDVGAGTGRASLALARRGARVTALDASPEMLRVARERAGREGASIELVVGDAHALQFPDRTFDAVVCLRVLMHTPDWRRSLAELCRVSARYVLFDYPALASAAALQAWTRRAGRAVGRPVEAYRVFSARSIRQALAAGQYRIVDSHKQFVLPIALHKQLGSRRFTESVEGGLAAVGLLKRLGSPVTVLAERCER